MPKRFTLAKLTDRKYSYTNCVYMHPNDMQELHIEKDEHVCIEEILVHRCRPDPALKEGTLGTSNLHWAALHCPEDAVGKAVLVEKWNEAKLNTHQIANTLTIVVDTYSKAPTQIEVEQLEKFIVSTFNDEVFCQNQRWIICWKQNGVDYWLSLRMANIYVTKATEHTNASPSEEKKDDKKIGGGGVNMKSRLANMQMIRFGKINSDTMISLMAANNPLLTLIQSGSIRPFGLDWDPEAMGIGGLDSQFSTIFRRAFASRLYPPELVQQLGVKHVKGMLLYGPPGTGKTLIARSIGKLLTDKEPKVVNGPEILNKFVGQSEENIRELFQDAKDDQEKNGDKAGLHIIIFDEIDAICKQRGTVGGGTGVHDTVVNQLLSMIDGVNSLNNILVIGMTNRKDLIDEALIRSGRLEVHIEIGLPDERGREQIFRIHTRLLREHGFLDESISLAEYAARTKNYSGAEIEAVVRSAVSYAMEEHIDVNNLQKIDVKKMKNIKITKQYFELALQEVQPEFGVNDEDLQINYARGIIRFNNNVQEIIDLSKKIITRLKNSNVMNRQSLLLQGDLACGKSALACFLAKDAEFPFVRLIRADDYVGSADATVCQRMAKVFDDAYKSNLSIVIIDDLERLIGYTIGARFSNAILQTILTSIRKNPNDLSRKIFIIATCTFEAIRTLQIDKMFDWVRDVPLVTTRDELSLVFKGSSYDKFCTPNLEDVISRFPEDNNGIGISSLLSVIELAVDSQDTITPDNFELSLQAKARHLDFYTNRDTAIPVSGGFAKNPLIPRPKSDQDDEEKED